MDASARREASELLFECWNARRTLDALPDRCRPLTRADGYAVQAELENRSAATVFGWKVAASSVAGQRHINVGGPLAGRMLSDRVRPDGGAVSIRGNRMRVAEVEFAFRMGVDLPPRAQAYRMEDALGAVASLHPAIEIPDSRYTDFTKAGEAQLIADAACADQFVLGPATPADWRAVDLAAHEVYAVDGRGQSHRGLGANVLGDPRLALLWMVNELSGIGVTLKAGQTVTTGVCMTPLPVEGGHRVQADFGLFGQVSVSFSD